MNEIQKIEKGLKNNYFEVEKTYGRSDGQPIMKFDFSMKV